MAELLEFLATLIQIATSWSTFFAVLVTLALVVLSFVLISDASLATIVAIFVAIVGFGTSISLNNKSDG